MTGFSVIYLVAGGLLGCGNGRGPAALLPSAEALPEAIGSSVVLTAEGEPGTPLVVSGRIYAPDGRTPAAGVTLHVYHTDARGIYSNERVAGQPPNPRIKGDVRTNGEGFYEFRTIRPASYPGSRNPQHIHAKVYGAGYAERWITDYLFDDDPLLTAEMRDRYKDLGAFSPVMKPTLDRDGRHRCVRDIRLERA